MSMETEIRSSLSEAPANMKKLDQLVRQGLMSPAQLPMLHRGLAKLEGGKALNPQEREAVNKVVQSMLYIVTGDDTVFQRAKQHTQRTRYQTESKEEYDNEGDMAKKQLTTLADAAQELMGMLSDNQNLPEWVQSKITKATDYLDTARDYMKSEGDDGKAPVGEETMSESYKEKFADALKKSGKSLAQMSDEEKKKFFNDVDASHKAKNEEAVDEGAFSRMATQSAEKQRLGANKVKGSGLETYKKKPAAKDTMVASPKTQRVKMTTAKAAERMVKKGAVYAEDLEENAQQAMRDAKRAARFDKKGMAPVKKQGGTKTHTGTKAGEERHGGHIVMQLRKAVTIGKPVKFKDGSEHKVSKADAHKFMMKYNRQKPADREKMHGAHDSHDSFQSHINK